jgi:hypothetical protein
MRCLYCDRSLGILRFRVTEPFCSLEHRTLHYRKSDPPLARLLETNPHLIDILMAPAMEEWIPPQAVEHEGTWPSHTLRYPEVASTGPLTKQFKVLTEIQAARSSHRPAPVEFSAVVYVVPPGDEQLMPADVRDRILRTSEYSATLRFTLKGSTRPARVISRAGMYGPEAAKIRSSWPASLPRIERPRLGGGPETDPGGLKPVDDVCRQGISLVPRRPAAPGLSMRRQEALVHGQTAPAIDNPLKATHSNVDILLEGPRDATIDSKLPEAGNPSVEIRTSAGHPLPTYNPDSRVDSSVAKLDPIRIPPNSKLILSWRSQAATDSCKPRRFPVVPPKNEPHPSHPPNPRDVSPRQARSASVFAVVLPALAAIPASTGNT